MATDAGHLVLDLLSGRGKRLCPLIYAASSVAGFSVAATISKKKYLIYEMIRKYHSEFDLCNIV